MTWDGVCMPLTHMCYAYTFPDNVATEAEATAIHGRMRRLLTAYQVVKKESATINDKCVCLGYNRQRGVQLICSVSFHRKQRHERVQQAKRNLDDELAPLRERLNQLESTDRPPSSPSSLERSHAQASTSRLPALNGNRKVKPPNYREVIAAIRDLKRARKSLLDPYIANLKVSWPMEIA